VSNNVVVVFNFQPRKLGTSHYGTKICKLQNLSSYYATFSLRLFAEHNSSEVFCAFALVPIITPASPQGNRLKFIFADAGKCILETSFIMHYNNSFSLYMMDHSFFLSSMATLYSFASSDLMLSAASKFFSSLASVRSFTFC
jgi:hypothetical protein